VGARRERLGALTKWAREVETNEGRVGEQATVADNPVPLGRGRERGRTGKETAADRCSPPVRRRERMAASLG
jgi:hypothetical protein